MRTVTAAVSEHALAPFRCYPRPRTRPHRPYERTRCVRARAPRHPGVDGAPVRRESHPRTNFHSSASAVRFLAHNSQGQICTLGGVTRGVDVLETHATRMTTAWGDSAARGKHGTMRQLSTACKESAKSRNCRAPTGAHIKHERHRRAQHQQNAPSRPSRRWRHPQRPPRARPPLSIGHRCGGRACGGLAPPHGSASRTPRSTAAPTRARAPRPTP